MYFDVAMGVLGLPVLLASLIPLAAGTPASSAHSNNVRAPTTPKNVIVQIFPRVIPLEEIQIPRTVELQSCGVAFRRSSTKRGLRHLCIP